MPHREPPATATSAPTAAQGKGPARPIRPRLERLPRAGTVVFDCDSTLSAIEGIEELAHEHQAEIAALTNAAMDGLVALEDVYGRRLALIRPDRVRVEALTRRYIEALVPDARETVAALRAEGVHVRVLSGGLLPAVSGVAASLGIAPDCVAAVGVRFDERGGYVGYDTESPLARTGGKVEMLARWRGQTPAPILLVGDGATDVEAREEVEVFVAFAGVVERAAVVAAADAVVRALSLAPILPLALGGERPRTAAARALFDRGMNLLDGAARAVLNSPADDSRK
jgi:phosphoserine phosphatase